MRVFISSLVVLSSNLSGFLNKFSPVGQFLCPLFKKQRRRFLLVKLCTAKVKFFFIVSLFVSFRSLIYIFLLVFRTVGVWMVLYK